MISGFSGFPEGVSGRTGSTCRNCFRFVHGHFFSYGSWSSGTKTARYVNRSGDFRRDFYFRLSGYFRSGLHFRIFSAELSAVPCMRYEAHGAGLINATNVDRVETDSLSGVWRPTLLTGSILLPNSDVNRMIIGIITQATNCERNLTSKTLNGKLNCYLREDCTTVRRLPK